MGLPIRVPGAVVVVVVVEAGVLTALADMVLTGFWKPYLEL